MAHEDDPRGNTRDRALGEAFNWVGRVFAVAVEMVLPGLAGRWLDQTWGINFLTPLGFVLGLVLGVTHLVVMVQSISRNKTRSRPDDGDRPL